MYLVFFLCQVVNVRVCIYWVSVVTTVYVSVCTVSGCSQWVRCVWPAEKWRRSLEFKQLPDGGASFKFCKAMLLHQQYVFLNAGGRMHLITDVHACIICSDPHVDLCLNPAVWAFLMALRCCYCCAPAGLAPASCLCFLCWLDLIWNQLHQCSR